MATIFLISTSTNESLPYRRWLLNVSLISLRMIFAVSAKRMKTTETWSSLWSPAVSGQNWCPLHIRFDLWMQQETDKKFCDGAFTNITLELTDCSATFAHPFVPNHKLLTDFLYLTMWMGCRLQTLNLLWFTKYYNVKQIKVQLNTQILDFGLSFGRLSFHKPEKIKNLFKKINLDLLYLKVSV